MSLSAIITAFHITPAGKGRMVRLLNTPQDASVCNDISRALDFSNGPGVFDLDFDDNDVEMPISKLTDVQIDEDNHFVNGVAITEMAISYIAAARDRLSDLLADGGDVRLFFSIA